MGCEGWDARDEVDVVSSNSSFIFTIIFYPNLNIIKTLFQAKKEEQMLKRRNVNIEETPLAEVNKQVIFWHASKIYM